MLTSVARVLTKQLYTGREIGIHGPEFSHPARRRELDKL